MVMRDVSERGYDRHLWNGHPDSIEDGDDPFMGSGTPANWPSYHRIKEVISSRIQVGERAWAYTELIDLSGLHEAKLTNGIVALAYFNEITKQHVIFCDPGPKAKLPRDYIVHAFCIPGTEEEESQAKAAMLTRLSDRGLLVYFMQAGVRIGVPRTQRAMVWELTGGRCWYCGMQTNPFIDFRVDHMRAVARGGTSDDDNLVPCCHPCNATKSASSVEQFRQKRGGGLFWFEEEGLSR